MKPTSSSVSRTSPITGWWMIVLLACAGGLVGYLSHRLMVMPIRYALASVMGLTFLTLAMIFIRRLPELLLYLIVLGIPLYTFEKTLFLRDTWVDFGTPGINIGLLDLLLCTLYISWLVEIVVLRSHRIPRVTFLDLLVAAFVFVHVLSAINSASVAYTLFEVYRVAKYALVYFYIAHRLERRHLKYILMALVFGLLLESALGVFQHRTHKLVGIARSKGALTAEMDTQYEVPEFEGHRRAEGTTIDSHALGVYLCMLLAYPLCLALCPWLRTRWRVLLGIAFLAGVPGLIATFSRGAWGAFAICTVTILVVFYLWGQRQALGVFIILGLLATPAIVIGGGQLIGKRVFRAPGEIMEARWDTVLTGLEIWKQSPWIGGGANAYFHAQRDLGMVYDLSNDKPAHNLHMYLLSQVGLIGMAVYLVMGLAFLAKCLTLMRGKDAVFAPWALAIFCGFLAVQADGMIDFMSFTNQPYLMQFVACGLIAGMIRLQHTSRKTHMQEAAIRSNV